MLPYTLELSPSVEWCGCGLGPSPVRTFHGLGPGCFLWAIIQLPRLSWWLSGKDSPAMLRGGGGAAAEERALLVVSSRTQRKESLFREIRSQARALGAALAVESRPDSGPGVGSPTAVIGGRRRRLTALAGARGSSGQRRGRGPGPRAQGPEPL